MTLEQIKQEVLKVPGTYEGESGNIRDNRKYLIIGQRGNVSKTLTHDIFKCSLNNLVYIQCLSEELQKEFIKIVWDYYGYSEDFKDNVERLQYITDMKIRLANEFEELYIEESTLMLKNDFYGAGLVDMAIYENKEIGTSYKAVTRKCDYINFEEKVRKHFEFDFAKEFDKLEEKYGHLITCKSLDTPIEMFIQELVIIKYSGIVKSERGKFSYKIETKEQFAVLIKYLDFCDKQYQERKEFLKGIK